MKHTNNPKRSRPRVGGGKKHSPNRGGGGYESASPEGKLRGSPQQILDKYLALAREAQTAGERIACEGFFQHAEHFLRVINADGNRQRNNNQPRRDQGERDRGQRGPDQQSRNTQDEKNQPLAQPEVQLEVPTAVGPIQVDQQPQPQLDLRTQPEQTSEAVPQQADVEKPKRPRRKPADGKKIDIVKEEASKPDVAPVQVSEEKPASAAS